MAKFGLESKSMLKTKHRGCWYYTKYFFFFLSIIQFLIILGLVLFMLYGNAHVGTELRLKSVENRYKNLTLDYTWLAGNFSQTKSKLTSTETQYANCTNLFTIALRQLQNRTVRPPIIVHPNIDGCKSYQNVIDRLNTSCIIETLQLKHQILLLQSERNRLRENCDQTIVIQSSRLNQTTSEKVKLQNEKEDLETQIKYLQTGCANINQRFDMELERMKNRLESMIGINDPFQASKCWSLSSDIKNNIDQTIIRLKQDVNNVMFENSQLKTDNARASANFQKCNQEKTGIISEKNQLSMEKGGLDKQLSEKKEELAKSYSKYMKKEEELENCRRMQPMGRVPGVHYPRT